MVEHILKADTFSKEKAQVLLTLVLFDSTYALRLVWNLVISISKLPETQTFLFITLNLLLSGLVFDLVPIALILYFHAKNFGSKEGG